MRSIVGIRHVGGAALGVALAVVVVLGAALEGASPAGAVTGPDHVPGVVLLPKLMHSAYEAGYSAIDAQPVTRFDGSITVPTVTCPATGDKLLFSSVSINGSTASANFGIAIECTTGTVYYSNSYADVGGATGATTIAPGQTLKFSLADNSSTGIMTATVTDPATDDSASASSAVSTPLSYVDAATETTAGSPIPSFTEEHLQNLKFDGVTLSTLGTLQKFNRYNGKTLQISTTKISAKGTFSTVFVHS